MGKNELDIRFTKFGTVSFAAVTQVNDFIGYLEEDKLMGTRCKQCGENFFPPRAHCYKCLSKEMEWFEVSGMGSLVSFSTLQYAPTGFTEDLPYTIALVDFGNCKVFGRMDREIPLDQLKVGMQVKARVSKTSNDKLTYVFVTA